MNALVPAFRHLSPAGPKARLSILAFHRVLRESDPLFPEVPDTRRFARVLTWLKGWCNVLPLDKAVERLSRGQLPERAAAITFDDGYADNYTEALPVLREHGMSATFFVATAKTWMAGTSSAKTRFALLPGQDEIETSRKQFHSLDTPP